MQPINLFHSILVHCIQLYTIVCIIIILVYSLFKIIFCSILLRTCAVSGGQLKIALHDVVSNRFSIDKYAPAYLNESKKAKHKCFVKRRHVQRKNIVWDDMRFLLTRVDSTWRFAERVCLKKPRVIGPLLAKFSKWSLNRLIRCWHIRTPPYLSRHFDHFHVLPRLLDPAFGGRIRYC